MSSLSAKKREHLKALAARPDSEIDFSDIPELTRFSADATIGRFYRPIKEKITVRIDADVLNWLKADGEGYQTRINDYLRSMMLTSRKKKQATAKKAGQLKTMTSGS
jgi:uncharacterized protein (DUF4415 family)